MKAYILQIVKEWSYRMELYQGAFIIVAVFGILMLILAVKTKSAIILNFLLLITEKIDFI